MPEKDIWKRLEEEKKEPSESIWDVLKEKEAKGVKGDYDLWKLVRGKFNLSDKKPKRAENVEISEVETKKGKEYILKDKNTDRYLKLGEDQVYVWNLMDGDHTVRDMMIETSKERGFFAGTYVPTIIQYFENQWLTQEKQAQIYAKLTTYFRMKRMSVKVLTMMNRVISHSLSIKNCDPFCGKLYSKVHFVFSEKLLPLYFFIGALGLWVFIANFSEIFNPEASLSFFATAGALGIAIYFVLYALVIITHEFAHALTVKKYGREVRSMGAMLYLLMPAFYADTSDIWLSGKKERIMVSFAGPLCTLLFGSVVVLIWKYAALSALLSFIFSIIAMMCFLLFFLNLNPLTATDGYYMLSDYIEIPNLRGKSFAFIKNQLPEKIISKFKKNEFSSRYTPREELIFTIFGIISLVWTVVILIVAINFWYGLIK